MSDFKFIYWWEWAHRFLGRFIGVAFALPLIYFTLTRRIERSLWPKLLALFILGGAQGALGWYMVSSGLVDRIDVSQYRLAAHLTLAALIFAAIIWVAKGVGRKRQYPSSSDDWFAIFLVVLILLQIAAGGFVAGLDAGQGYATWPKMDGQWIPSGLLDNGAGLEKFLRERDDRAIQPPRSGLCPVARSHHSRLAELHPASHGSGLCRFCPGLPWHSDIAPARAAGRSPRPSGGSHDRSGRSPSGTFTRGLSSDRLIQIRNNVGHVFNAD